MVQKAEYPPLSILSWVFTTLGNSQLVLGDKSQEVLGVTALMKQKWEALQACRHLLPSQGTRDVPTVGLGRNHMGSWWTRGTSPSTFGDSWLRPSTVQTLVVIYPNPTQMWKIGQMNHALKVSVCADYKGSPGWPALLETSALWIHGVRWEKSHISHCSISVSYLEHSLLKIKGYPRLQGYLILHWAA